MSILLALAAASTGLPAGEISLSMASTDWLVSECQKSRGLQLDPCVSFILGVADTLQLHRHTCRSPSSAATLQTVEVARRHVVNTPEAWGTHPAFLVRAALTKAFPCR